ncbi:radical SAM protein [Thermodesulfatator autotrophicus]|uniref:Radical SAM core domain-containing protein n=1 Tax=Thermodesulfatator autotrophicus TaxID=1795632 RepID=A0A177E7E7_9BACT|nr:radical SAM protein [Thermodesulfatator autotrophicus]OAG27873.1 hypothetical protein TH606_04895 [Thermodesulfatator autotrophicus]
MNQYIEKLLNRFEKEFYHYRVSNGFTHPKFRDLSSPSSVSIKSPFPKRKLLIDDSLIIHVTVTGRCNARCKGCINVSITCGQREELLTIFEAEPKREVLGIKRLSDEFPNKKVTVVFYGGEPLLAPQKIRKIQTILRKELPHKEIRFMVITNGMLIDRVYKNFPEIIQDVWLFSISIDGQKEQHESIRIGTSLEKIQQNLSILRKSTRSKILMWSTLREEQSLKDCFLEFLYLYQEKLVDFFFYHFAETEEPFKNFNAYIKQYEKDFNYLLDTYLDYLKKNIVLPITHLNELIAFLLSGHKRGHTACGVELATNFDLVGGKILACADLPPELALGQITPDGQVSLSLESLPSLVAYKNYLSCDICGIEPYCGGRCPVQALTGSVERTLAYCQLLRLHVGMVIERLPEIKRHLERLSISYQDLYDHSGFLARYTDVIP